MVGKKDISVNRGGASLRWFERELVLKTRARKDGIGSIVSKNQSRKMILGDFITGEVLPSA